MFHGIAFGSSSVCAHCLDDDLDRDIAAALDRADDPAGLLARWHDRAVHNGAPPVDLTGPVDPATRRRLYLDGPLFDTSWPRDTDSLADDLASDGLSDLADLDACDDDTLLDVAAKLLETCAVCRHPLAERGVSEPYECATQVTFVRAVYERAAAARRRRG